VESEYPHAIFLNFHLPEKGAAEKGAAEKGARSFFRVIFS